MKVSAIIRCIKRNIEKYGSLYGIPDDCILCKGAQKRASQTDWKVFEMVLECDLCPLWNHITRPSGRYSECSDILYKGAKLFASDYFLNGNKPALRALLNGLINAFNKGELNK